MLASRETPERLYDRAWCLELLSGVLEDLRDDYGASGARLFAAPGRAGEKKRRSTYRTWAERLARTEHVARYGRFDALSSGRLLLNQ